MGGYSAFALRSPAVAIISSGQERGTVRRFGGVTLLEQFDSAEEGGTVNAAR